MVFSSNLLNIFSRSRDIQVFVHNLMTSQIVSKSGTKINNKIKNISGNIGVMLLKLGTNNASQTRNKMTPIRTSPWHFSWPQSLSVMNQISPFLTR